MSVSFKRQTLSQKEIEAKAKLMGKPKEQTKQQSSPPTKEVQPKNQFNAIYQAPTNQQIDQFLKNMETDFQQISQKQVTMGMLSTQQQLIKQQLELVSQKQPSIETQVQQMLQPITQQIQEIKQAQNIQKESPNKKVNLQELEQQNAILLQNQQQLLTMISQLKSQSQVNNLDTVLLPINQQLQEIKYLQNFQAQQKANPIILQVNPEQQYQNSNQYNPDNDPEQNLRYKQLNDARNAKNVLQNTQIEQEILQRVQQQIESIDYVKAKQNISIKLGGEFEYDQLLSEVNDYVKGIENICQDYVDDGKRYDLNLPEFKLDESELEALNTKQTSILDDLKAQLGIVYKPNQPPKIVPQQVPIQVSDAGKKQTLKPNHIAKIPTKPQEMPKDIRLEKQGQTTNFTPLVKEQKIEERQIRKDQKEEKLIYRKPAAEYKQQQIKQQSIKQQFGEIQYLKQDESFDEPQIQINYKPQQPLSEIQYQNNQSRQNYSKDIPVQDYEDNYLFSQQQFGKYNQDNVDQYKTDNRFKDTYNYEQLNQQKYEALNDPRFVNYDQLINQISEQNEYTTIEQKSGQVLKMLGVEQQNPRNEQDLLELLSKDILKEKIIQNTRKPKEQFQDQRVLKNQSIQASQSEQPVSLQEQANQGAQALIQGFLQAINSTISSINVGIGQAINPIQQRPMDTIESSSEEEEIQIKEQQQTLQMKQQVQQQKTQPIQQYTFSSKFQGPQPKNTNVDLDDYYKKFDIQSEIYSDNTNRSGSYAGSIFKLDDSYGKKSEGQVSINDFQTRKKKSQDIITKDIFRDLDQDISDGEIKLN